MPNMLSSWNKNIIIIIIIIMSIFISTKGYWDIQITTLPATKMNKSGKGSEKGND